MSRKAVWRIKMKTISYLLNDNLIIIEKGAYKVAIIYQLNYVVVVSLTYDVEGKPFVPLAKSCNNAILADEAKSDLYTLGYFGKFNGTDMVCLRQVHKPGTSAFAMNNSKLYVLAGDDKPVKVVNEGEGLLIDRDPTENNDLTKEYVYGQPMGVGVACSEKMGVFTFTD